MKYKMPNLAEIRGYNEIQVPPIIIEPEGKENPIHIAEKIIQKVIEISPWYRWPPQVPKKKFLSQERINQLARTLKKHGRICLGPACLKLTMKNGRILLNVTYWINSHGNGGDPRPLKDLQLLEQQINNVATEVNNSTREEATSKETQEIIHRLAMEFRPENI